MSKYVDRRAGARFHSLWQVVVHATTAESDRWKAYAAAQKAMIKHGKWRGYGMVFSPVKRQHVGYRFANPKDWFLLLDDGAVDGPFQTKASILRRLQLKKSKVAGNGIYTVPGATLFTRDAAPGVGLKESDLP